MVTSAPPQPATAQSGNPSAGHVVVTISLTAACKWAYPGRASGRVSGSSYAISCLGAGGEPLGGFSGTHSLNAWCADSGHTNGKHAPSPALVKGRWVCSSGQSTHGPSGSLGGGRVSVTIPLAAACKWAYPGQASGTVSGAVYSLTCLGASGLTLGGFSGTHSLNAWCADPRHTNGKHAPSPALVKGTWVCGSGQPAPGSSASSSAGHVAVTIPLTTACKWAYPGHASGKVSGSGYAITCLGLSGQPLGGFSGTHSLNAWCADPRHTNGKHAPSPALVKRVWACTR